MADKAKDKRLKTSTEDTAGAKSSPRRFGSKGEVIPRPGEFPYVSVFPDDPSYEYFGV